MEGGPFKPFFGLSGADEGCGHYIERKRGSSKSPHNKNRVVWATLYNRVGVVKRHVECPGFARLSERR